MTHKVFEGNTYTCILTGVDVTSRYAVARALRTKNESEIPFFLETINKKDVVLKYLKVFQCDNGSDLRVM